MSWKHLPLAVLAVFSAGQAKEPEDILLSVPHGSFPELTKYQWEGKLPRTGDPVGATFSSGRDGWDVLVTRGAQDPLRVLLRAKRLADIHPERSLLWSSYDEEELRLDIPFGRPREDCFANGEEVFESIQISMSKDGKTEVQESRIEKCEAKYRDLAPELKSGSIVIAD